jgi:hypothetical protein
MASFVSPGVYVIEKDLSDYPVSINPSVVGVVGFADQGPINKATLITSQERLIQTFGNPNESITGQGLEGSIEILETTNSMYFVRCSDADTAADASATVIIGSCPSFRVSAGDYGTSASVYFKVQVNVDGKDQYPEPKGFAVPAGTSIGSASSQATALISVFGGGLDGTPIGSFYGSSDTANGWVTAGYAGSGVVLTASSYSDSTYATPLSALQIVTPSGGVESEIQASTTVSITGIDILSTGVASSLAYSVQSLYPGRGYNEGANTDGTTSGVF